MNEEQRKAMVAGWYVARYTGRLRLPGEGTNVRAVQVWDKEEQAWLSFPCPLIVPQPQLDQTRNNYLPAVLLSYGLALAQVTDGRDLSPLRPYTAMRQFWDASDSGDGPHGPDNPAARTAASYLSQYFAGDLPSPPGAPERFRAQLTGTLSVDVKAMVDQVSGVRDRVGTDYLPPTEGGPRGGGKWAQITRVDDLWGVPLFHEVAPDVYWALGKLLDVLEHGIRGAMKHQDEGEVV
jgi:hypothetical protein